MLETEDKTWYAHQDGATEQDEMTWIEPGYSKKKIGKAGEVLIEKSSDLTKEEASQILSNWRASHTYPLNSIQSSLRYRAKQIDRDYLLAQRLKRVVSIKNKLKRFSAMKLQRMQDIGGCRTILSTIGNVYELKDKIINTESLNIIREYDYIKEPKESGYRGIHLISEYCGKQEAYKGLKIEIQLRSKIQHYWATAVETIGTFTKQELKAGTGGEEWLSFLQTISLLMAQLENKIPPSKIELQRLKQLERKLKIRQKLITYSVFAEIAEERQITEGMFLISLDVEQRIINIKYFKDNALVSAIKEYKTIEEEYLNNDTVLVKAKSILDLRKGYPNYFADSRYFLDYLNFFLDQS